MFRSISSQLRKIAFKSDLDLLTKSILRIIENKTEGDSSYDIKRNMRTIIDGVSGETRVIEPLMKKKVREIKKEIAYRTKEIGLAPRDVIDKLRWMKSQL